MLSTESPKGGDKSDRWPIGPLLAMMPAYLHVKADELTDADIAVALHVHPSQLGHYRTHGIDGYTADRLAQRLGRLPWAAELWGQAWLDAAPVELACFGCGTLFLPVSELHRKWCTRKCMNRVKARVRLAAKRAAAKATAA